MLGWERELFCFVLFVLFVCVCRHRWKEESIWFFFFFLLADGNTPKTPIYSGREYTVPTFTRSWDRLFAYCGGRVDLPIV